MKLICLRRTRELTILPQPDDGDENGGACGWDFGSDVEDGDDDTDPYGDNGNPNNILIIDGGTSVAPYTLSESTSSVTANVPPPSPRNTDVAAPPTVAAE